MPVGNLRGQVPRLRFHCPQFRQQQFPRAFKKDWWTRMIEVYKPVLDQLKFDVDVIAWAGKPMSGWLHDGIDISQVTCIKAREVWTNKIEQSLYSTLFASTPTAIRQHLSEAVKEGLPEGSLTLYHWHTRNGRMHTLFAIRCNHCSYRAHGKWKKSSPEAAQCSLSRFLCSCVCPPKNCNAHTLTHLPRQH